MNRNAIVLIALLSSAAPAWAQVIVPAAPTVPAIPIDSDEPPDEAAIMALPPEVREKVLQGRASGEAGPLGKSAESPRMKKLRALTFDRRPSAILKTWATPLPVAPAKDFVGPLSPDQKDTIDVEVETYQRFVVLSQWAEAKKYLKGLPEAEGTATYKQLLQVLSVPQMGRPQMPPMDMSVGMAMGMVNPGMAMQFMERNAFTAEDVVGLAAAAPQPLEKEQIAQLSGILRQAISAGTVVEVAVARLRAEVAKPEHAALTRRQAAQLLVAAGSAAEIGEFLPDLARAEKDNDCEALNLIARYAIALHAKDKKPSHLEDAWLATQAALLAPNSSKEDKEESLRRAVEIAPKIREGLGQAWLEASFTQSPQRGMEILATLGTALSQNLATNLMNAEPRLKTLQLQKAAVSALLKAAPDRAKDWRTTLTLLANNWMREGELSHQYAKTTSLGGRITRDPYGNMYYMDEDFYPYGMPQQRNQPAFISISDVLENRPDDAWLTLVADDLRPKLAAVYAQLYLKVNEEAKAFPYIEHLATSHPQKAKELVNEFIRVWTENHDPNGPRRRTNPYMFMYGFERRSEGIPLTRSKQERNLADLGDWVARLRKLPLGDLDEELLAKAFTTCHSTAEVYRLELVQSVFGPLETIKPKTLAQLAQQMRENLGGVWRSPKVQQDKKTNRRPKDIQAEVLRGYEVARNTVDNAKGKFPTDWSLQLALAALMQDETAYRQEVAKDSNFAASRKEAMTAFAKAAELYAAKVRDLPEEEQSIRVYEQWLYASLGAADLDHVDEHKQPDLRQPALIRAAILALPGDLAEKHMSRFANSLFTHMSSVNPAVKFRYLRSGFEIVGDHKQAIEARKIFEYYRDLVSELKLDATIDGSDVVGHGQPFGVFVNLRHTREIERESGGFGRYLQNQSNMFFSYNYGRPTADYRDKFQVAATDALKEHFEVHSITFQTENVNSRATNQYGWRTTPYAYVLLKARGPHVDKLPPLHMDLDFLDTSGYVVLPIESPAVPLDAKLQNASARPARKIQVTQILDERQADKGKLVLEVKASSLGLVPELDQLLTLQSAGFDRVKVDAQPLAVAKFDQDADDIAVVSERNWMISYEAKATLAERPKSFEFGTKKMDDVELAYQRYQDADLTNAQPVIALEREYGKPSRSRLWWTLAGIGALLAAVGAMIFAGRRRKPIESEEWSVPEPLTPFTVLGLLRRLGQDGHIKDTQWLDLQESIRTLEHAYFANGSTDGPNLREAAQFWMNQARLARKAKSLS